VKPPPGWSRYYRIVARVPRGRVITYGEVAALAGRAGAAREVGYALAALRGSRIRLPWQRVLGKRSGDFAGISLLDPMGAAVQRDLLEREGVVFDERERIPLREFGWRPRRRAGSGARPRRSQPRASRRARGPRPRSPRRTGGWSCRS